MFVELYDPGEKVEPNHLDDKHVIKEPSLANDQTFAWTQRVVFLAVCVGVIVTWFRVRPTVEGQTKSHPV